MLILIRAQNVLSELKQITNISLKKGCRGNNAGDGPRLESEKQRGLKRNGFALVILSNRLIPSAQYCISEILVEVLQRKFGTVFPHVSSMVLEINRQCILQFRKSIVMDMICNHDITHLKYVNTDDLQERDIYSIDTASSNSLLHTEYAPTSSEAGKKN